MIFLIDSTLDPSGRDLEILYGYSLFVLINLIILPLEKTSGYQG